LITYDFFAEYFLDGKGGMLGWAHRREGISRRLGAVPGAQAGGRIFRYASVEHPVDDRNDLRARYVVVRF